MPDGYTMLWHIVLIVSNNFTRLWRPWGLTNLQKLDIEIRFLEKKTKKRVYLAYLQVLAVPVKKNTIFSHSISSLCMKTEKKHFFFAPVDFVFLIWFAIFFFIQKKVVLFLPSKERPILFFFTFFPKCEFLILLDKLLFDLVIICSFCTHP